MAIRRIHRDDIPPSVPMISADARLLVWPGTGARYANMNWVRLEPGEENRPHRHEASEDTIYIIRGRGSVENLDTGAILEFQAGDAVYVTIGVRHAVRADRGSAVVSVGGPTPPDWVMLRAVQGALGADASEPDAGAVAGAP